MRSVIYKTATLPAIALLARTFLAFMASHPNATTKFTQGTAEPGQGDVMAAFSSRGPSPDRALIKPDITAPGVVTPATRPLRSSMRATGLFGEATSTRPGNRSMVTNATSGRPSAAIWIETSAGLPWREAP